MRRPVLLFLATVLSFSFTVAYGEIVLEPFTYFEDFELRSERGWASYPQWQDTAYDPNFRANEIVPGDPNISLVQLVTPYTNVDNYAGAMKNFDAYIIPGSSITLRYYIKSHLPSEWIKVRLASGPDGKLDVTFDNPPVNRWEWVTVTWDDFVRENPRIAGKSMAKVNVLALLVKIPDADPAMEFYFGLDDVTFKGAQALTFKFAEPLVHKLPDWKPFIPDKHYTRGERFNLIGRWPLPADRVTLNIICTSDTSKTVLSTNLRKEGDNWSLRDYRLNWPEGMYLATLKARNGETLLSDTQFTMIVAPSNIGGKHPRLWFDSNTKKTIESRLKSERFRAVYENILSSAKEARESTPLHFENVSSETPDWMSWWQTPERNAHPGTVVFDIDRFPDEDWIPSLGSWSRPRINRWRQALYWNALSYAFSDDKEAGVYCKDLLVRISRFPYLLHPWMIKRGHHIYYPIGELGMDMALAYDLTYELMNEEERRVTRDGMMRFVVEGCHEGYVVDNLVLTNTSNWVAHITGGSIMCMLAMYGDSPETAPLEPYFTGAILKNHDLIQKSFCRDGEYGEGYGYYNFSMLSWSKSLPALENVFNIDHSAKIDGSYKGLIWAGRFQDRETFYFGDTRFGGLPDGRIRPMTNWAWLLDKYKDPLLGYMYNHMKSGEGVYDYAFVGQSAEETFMDVLYETRDVPRKAPFDENPVKLFRDVGTTVFKSGWERDDFIFVLRTGPFYNHQHLDQGTFWLADRGTSFIEERTGSTYYTDPLYQSWFIQPIAHSIILIDNNHQSQRAGDLLWHAEGFDDYAFVGQFLDGERASFVSGDIGRVYWDKVESLKRNVLYLKPRTLLMLDTAVPAEEDVDVTLLYQTPYLKDITAGREFSTIAIDGNTLHIRHLSPADVRAEAVETPHYINTLQENAPVGHFSPLGRSDSIAEHLKDLDGFTHLEREGMLTITARTNRTPLVIGNLLTTTTGDRPDITTTSGTGFVAGMADGVAFAYSTSPGSVYTAQGVRTDAVAITGDENLIFAAMAKTLSRDGRLVMESSNPITFEVSSSGFKYNACENSELILGAATRPSSVTLNGSPVKYDWNQARSAVVLRIPEGDGKIVLR